MFLCVLRLWLVDFRKTSINKSRELKLRTILGSISKTKNTTRSTSEQITSMLSEIESYKLTS